jgi:hypothetical protein
MKKALLFFLALVSLPAHAITAGKVHVIPTGKTLPDWGQVQTAGIADSAVTTAKLNDSAVTTAKINDSAVTTAKVNDGAITTAKLADGGITQAKRAALGQQVSSSCGTSYSNSTSSYTDVTNLSVSITTTGRPVLIFVQSDGTGSSNYGTFAVTKSGDTAYAQIRVLRGATEISQAGINVQVTASGTTSLNAGFPPSTVLVLDTPSAGTYTYKVQARSAAATVWCSYAKLVALEL